MLSFNSIAKAAVFIVLLVIPATIYLYFIAQLKSLPKLGYFGPREAISKTVDGELVTDTLYHEVPEFSFINQNNQVITDNHFKGRVYVADFFFASCQSICPIMSSQLERVQAKYRDNDQLGILSHTVDPESDSVAVLRSYASLHEALDNKWEFITGNKKEIYEIARKGYFVSASEGDGGEEDFIHSPYFVLVDTKKHLRGFYDGTDSLEVNKLLVDIDILLAESKKQNKKTQQP
jgi:protein SCO1/2